VRIFDAVGCARVREYIERNPVKRGLALNPAEYIYSSANGLFKLDDVPQGLKPRSLQPSVGTSEDVP
jgi:hypothetical protein